MSAHIERDGQMPKFATISPTCAEGRKEEAWELFRNGGYAAIGWCYGHNLTAKDLEWILPMMRHTAKGGPSDIRDGERSLRFFCELCQRGEKGYRDYIAVKNVNHGLFGIGIIESGYNYCFCKHPTLEDENHNYDHYLRVNWIHTEYIKTKDLNIPEGEGWVPRGTLDLIEYVPKYIRKFLENRGHTVLEDETS
jgi:hypothetical protein